MLGIATAGDALLKATTWQNGINALCIIGRRKLSTRLAVMADKETERLPHLYLAVIFAQDRKAWELTDQWTASSPREGQARRPGTPTLVSQVPANRMGGLVHEDQPAIRPWHTRYRRPARRTAGWPRCGANAPPARGARRTGQRPPHPRRASSPQAGNGRRRRPASAGIGVAFLTGIRRSRGDHEPAAVRTLALPEHLLASPRCQRHLRW